jgi:hypothetical protein
MEIKAAVMEIGTHLVALSPGLIAPVHGPSKQKIGECDFRRTTILANVDAVFGGSDRGNDYDPTRKDEGSHPDEPAYHLFRAVLYQSASSVQVDGARYTHQFRLDDIVPCRRRNCRASAAVQNTMGNTFSIPAAGLRQLLMSEKLHDHHGGPECGDTGPNSEFAGGIWE